MAQQGERENKAFSEAVSQWFLAWSLVKSKVYKLPVTRAVDFVFFDSLDVYSTSILTVPGGELITGPPFMNSPLTWRKMLHHDSLLLPDSQVVPISLISFAGQLKSGKSFFVMPLPSFWKSAGVKSKELGLENLITGVFLHEFSHTQQMQNFGKRITLLENASHFDKDFTDDLVQVIFEKDSSYKKNYEEEKDMFYNVFFSGEKKIRTRLIVSALKKMHQRQQKYFTGKYIRLREIDDFFLTMEGVGQFSMYAWLVHPEGANISSGVALKGVRRGGRWWSQEEGLALILALSTLNSPKEWGKLMFGETVITARKLIESCY
ncbi:MAG: hypothetical protein ABIT96_11470 [Ferruginibacter sp.]